MVNFRAKLVPRDWRLRAVFAMATLGILGLCAWGGTNLWASHQLGAAREAVDAFHFTEARSHIQLCLKVWPDDADAQFLAARIERRLGDFSAAEKHLKAYKRIRGVTDEFQTEWILMRAQGGDLPQLELSLWNCVNKNHPQSIEILETLAACFIRESRFQTALSCLDEWVKREPASCVALQWRALAREQVRAREDALNDYRQVLKLDPTRWYVRLQVAQLLLEMAHYPEALPELEILNKTHADDDLVQLTWGRCLLSQGETAAARKVLRRLAQAGTKLPQVFYYLGTIEPEPGEAEQWFRKALKIQPANLEARFALYTRLQQSGRSKEAAAELRLYQATKSDQEVTKKLHDKMERDPNNPELLSQLGTHLLEKLNNPQGLHILHRALAFDAHNRKAREALIQYYEANNQPEQAARHREALENTQ